MNIGRDKFPVISARDKGAKPETQEEKLIKVLGYELIQCKKKIVDQDYLLDDSRHRVAMLRMALMVMAVMMAVGLGGISLVVWGE